MLSSELLEFVKTVCRQKDVSRDFLCLMPAAGSYTEVRLCPAESRKIPIIKKGTLQLERPLDG
ncbi:hypothetical protein B5E42_16970 [Flavonifractor sp. An10]|nr:hypothetical protein B5E42_16970 [Flavonifractor sp. An10]